jgi:hypothetical protein
MRLSAAIASAALLASALTAASGVTAAAAVPANHSYAPVTVKVAGKTCTKTAVNGMRNNGTLFGTENCGRPEAFTMTKAGAVNLYKLPASDARFTYASNISSNGIEVLDGSTTSSGVTTGYLLSPRGRLTVLRDPRAQGHGTVVNGVNRSGEAVGYICLTAKCSRYESFTYRHGVFTKFSLNVRGATDVIASTITDSGQIDGDYRNSHHVEHAFQQSPSGSVRIITAPSAGKKAGQGTYLLGGSSNGSVCGYVLGAHHSESGFVEIHHTAHLVNAEPDGPGTYFVTDVLAINSHGEFGGEAFKPGHAQGVGFTAHR